MVHKEEAHDFAGFLNLKGKLVVCFAGERTVARMVVTEGDDGGIVEYGFLDEQSDIHGSFRNASVRDTGSLDELEIDDLKEFALYANACGSLSSTKHGAIPAMPTDKEIRGLMEKGKIIV